ncbi:uncharacterized protein PgNI_09075 [Pyricularia grisea]|uniref:Cytochrome P450 n=1 Tax=Pyricularia grisea TaxID=148305 RepID=A0A6P8ARN5_PYRGI|nr:uncharacterized protein PgNI_09075 [Pyricularia grisea]TLD04773.1 hypothetical protein PgNI_09075 [Pyricularia grisea]
MSHRSIIDNMLALDCGTVIVLALGLLISFLAAIAIYRLSLHPYAKYPGPFLAKLTSWYSVYHAFVRDLHTDIWDCHQKYGPVVRYAPNRILVNTKAGLRFLITALVAAIYGHGSNTRKSKAYLRISLVPGVHATLGTIDDWEHGKLRRILNQSLSEGQIRGMDNELSAAARLFAERLGARSDPFGGSNPTPAMGEDQGWTAPKNLAHWCDYFTFDVMSQLVFGTLYGLLTSSDNHWIIGGVLSQVRRVGFCMQLPEIEDLGLHKLLYPTTRPKALRFSQTSREIME